MLDVLIFLPLAASLLMLPRAVPDRVARLGFVVVTAVDLALAVALWIGYDGSSGITGGFAYERDVPWIPTLSSSYHVGLDGLSLPMVALTAGLFLACAIWSLPRTDRPRSFAALFLFLETTCLGVFASLDLLLFFVFFDLSIVGMYFVIAGWGHGDAARSALRFFLYTFLGSLALLVGFIGLYLASDPHTFDMVTLARNAPLAASPGAAALVLAAISLGLAVKTPTVPFHTWLPPAHSDAPAAGSAVLAGVLLKMGTYGFLRIVLPILPGALRTYAVVFVVVGVVSVLYGALVALAQTNLKRLIAYTSVNHMGYIVLAVGAAALGAPDDASARSVAVTGAVTQMVSHGLITGALFLLAGALYDRTKTYAIGEYGGLAGRAPRLSLLFAVGAFASLGLPAFSGFIAEFQIFTGALATTPVAVCIALLGLLVTAALFLWAVQRLLLGAEGPATRLVTEVRASELAAIGPLLLLSLVVGVVPRFLLDVIEPAARALVALVPQ